MGKNNVKQLQVDELRNLYYNNMMTKATKLKWSYPNNEQYIYGNVIAPELN